MGTPSKNWLQLYVDAMVEKDPFKRLGLVRELNRLTKEDNSGEAVEQRAVKPLRRSKQAPRR